MSVSNDTLALLENVKSGSITPEEALMKLKTAPFEDIGYAKIDNHRRLRQGAGEVIYGQSKTSGQISGIVSAMLKNGAENILVTRISQETADLLSNFDIEYHPIAKIGVVARKKSQGVGNIVVATGGTSDMPAAEEAAITAEVLGSRVTRLYDVGVAGLHRLLGNIDTLISARVVVAAAGMEGALASVIGGLVDCPVVAVPTSV